ncbi:MAG: UDP-N-acetyl-D-mannosamine dehydrogenase [Planctomycetaceae bacterium]|jgi:UDP-N-acetyl-D-mannosaminuronic acid dehydrogenase|nr:UDP-N-acetyl-D-mannosamine dehydrogenase [Planctomycetaceae bacterium]
MATATVTGSATTNAAQAELSSTQIRKRSALGERRRSLRAGDGLRVCVVGLGYIGLPTASILGTKGCRVFGVDVSPQVVDTINAGRIHIEEPDLDLIVKAAVQAGNLTAATVPSEADVFVLAVPTPIQPDKQPDVSMVESAARAIAPYVRKGNLVILESTSPVGTTDGVVARVLREAGHVIGEDVYVAYCPERVLPGRILTELIENDRVVGGVDDASTEVALEFYQGFVRGEVVGTDSRTAEMVKLSENSYRDVNIAYANELSMVCDRAGISVWEVIRIANRHPRVKILQPGPGVGGHCIAVDPWFIVAGDPQNAKVIRAAREVNDRKPHWVIDKVEQCARRVVDPVIACLGLSFKADVDDLRESPAVEIVHELKRRNLGELLVVEPHLLFHPDFELVKLEEAVRRANIVLVLVDHKPFKRLRRDALNEKILIDTRGLFL